MGEAHGVLAVAVAQPGTVSRPQVTGLIPRQGTYPGHRFDPQSGHIQEATDLCFSLTSMSLSLSLSLSLLFLSVPKINGRKSLGENKKTPTHYSSYHPLTQSVVTEVLTGNELAWPVLAVRLGGEGTFQVPHGPECRKLPQGGFFFQGAGLGRHRSHTTSGAFSKAADVCGGGSGKEAGWRQEATCAGSLWSR